MAPSKTPSIRNIFLITVLLGILVWTFYFLFEKSNTPPEIFKTLQPFDTGIVKKTVATGSVTPRKEVNMKSLDAMHFFDSSKACYNKKNFLYFYLLII